MFATVIHDINQNKVKFIYVLHAVYVILNFCSNKVKLKSISNI